jgi:transcriptional regulator with XRE-family HTH domain
MAKSEILPERLAEARMARGISQSELAKKMGMTRLKISKLERGHIKATKEMLFLYMTALDFPVGFFYKTLNYEVYDFKWGTGILNKRTQKWETAFLKPNAYEIDLMDRPAILHDNGIEFI